MEQLQSIDQIRRLVADVRAKRKGFVTNFYLDEFKHSVWIQNGDFYFESINDTLFLVKKSDGFWNIFYGSTAIDTLANDVVAFQTFYKEITMLFDIVGRDIQCEILRQQFNRIGFKEATSLVRMTRITESMDYDEDLSVVKATDDEVKIVYQLLHHYFDAQTEQIPYLSELEYYANGGHILVCHEDGQLAGFLIYEINATTNYLRYWFTHPDFRDKKVGSRLLRRFFEEGKETKRQLFWVIRSNENAIKRYRHYGFSEENMYDYVMINK